MKRILSILAITFFTLSFSQTYVKVTSDKQLLEDAYKGGKDKFESDLVNNISYTANAFQVSGDFKLNFTVNENGEISDVKVLPKLYDKSFEREVKRDLGRMKKHFASNQKQNISVGLSVGRDIMTSDGREAFTAREPFVSSAGSR